MTYYPNAIERWNAAVAEKTSKGMSVREAIRAVIREDPDLHKAYLAQYNQQVQSGAAQRGAK